MTKFAVFAILLIIVQATLAAPKWPYPWDTAEVCKPNVDVGQKCKAVTTKWHYDPKTNTCKQFKYGGCKGNTNRFDNENICFQTCIPLN